MPAIVPERRYRNVYLLESKAWWPSVAATYDPRLDLVLTFDFGLRQEISTRGGHCAYIDHLRPAEYMQSDNFAMYQFFRDWHKDGDGSDVLNYRGVDFGSALRIEIWNDFTHYVRLRLCLDELLRISFSNIFVGEEHADCRNVLHEIGISNFILVPRSANALSGYFFPAHRWMDERLRARNLRRAAKDLVMAAQGVAMDFFDRFVNRSDSYPRVFVQEYYPTRKLLQSLIATPGISVVQAHFSSSSGMSKLLRERLIPVYGCIQKRKAAAGNLLANLRSRRAARLVLSSGIDATDGAYRIIDQRIGEVLPRVLRNLDCVISYLDRHPLRLSVLIGNLGQLAMLVDAVAKARGVPSYTIINGLLGNAYMDEAKYSTRINSYGPSIRDNYFAGMDNVVCLGDPRMDEYVRAPHRSINRARPTVAIAAAGFNNIDLNSYVAFEFEFAHQVLTAVTSILGKTGQILLKVRANGYADDYRRFVEEWFCDFDVKIISSGSVKDLLANVDLFITFYSQTLFEASCLGIPCIFHKADEEVMDPPFDGRSEIVTTTSVDELRAAVLDFLAGHKRFDSFLRYEVMEKYIGPLDGRNLRRNHLEVCRMMGLALTEKS
jgi:hypothetical protein